MSYIKKIIFLFLLFLLSVTNAQNSFAEAQNKINQPITLDMQNINIRDALHIIAASQHINLVISPHVSGTVSLHLNNTPATRAIHSLLSSQNLSEYWDNQILYVLPTDELMQQKQMQLKLEDAIEAAEPLVLKTWQIHYAKTDDINHVIGNATGSLLSKRGHISIDTRTNQICIEDTPAQIEKLDQLIKRIDKPVQQVVIEARLASIDSDYERDLGIHFSVQNKDQNVNPSHLGAETAFAAGNYGLAIAKLADGNMLDIQLAALENEGHGELISSPRLFTANQQTASIESGEEIPYQEISRSGATGVAFKKAVLSLKVTPQVLPGNNVLLQMQINQDKPSNRMILGVPAITTREVSTQILAANGQTIALGGIFETSRDNLNQSLPFFSKIPFIGHLFGQQTVTKNKRELLIFVTPKVISFSGN